MSNPNLVSTDAFQGRRVVLSISDSQDLARLGLTPGHLELVVSEVARAVILGGGVIVYGGRIRPAGFTQLIIDEIQRYGSERLSLELFVPEPEYRELSIKRLEALDRQLGISGRLYLLTPSGEPQTVSQLRGGRTVGQNAGTANALTAMREKTSEIADARVILGGKLDNYEGSEPGVIEEARLSVEAGKALYVAGGYGGAAASIARALMFDGFDWAPPQFPANAEDEDVQNSLSRLQASYAKSKNSDGLSVEERRVLAVSHRPANVATAVSLGLSRLFGGDK